MFNPCKELPLGKQHSCNGLVIIFTPWSIHMHKISKMDARVVGKERAPEHQQVFIS